MKRIRGGRAALRAAAWAMGALVAGASPALAQGGFDILTLRGQGSSIGVEIMELDADKAKASAVENGVMIANVRPDTPADQAVHEVIQPKQTYTLRLVMTAFSQQGIIQDPEPLNHRGFVSYTVAEQQFRDLYIFRTMMQ